MRRFFVLNFVACALLFSSVYAKPLELEVSAKSAILINPETKAILFEKNARERAFPASITKVATALYLLETKGSNLDETVKASDDALIPISPEVKKADYNKYPPYRLERDGHNIGIQAGEILSYRSLLNAMLLESGNDAANVLGAAAEETIPVFIEKMNTFLLGIGCSSTHFLNPHGLHHPDHYTTAYDMAQIASRALQLPVFRTTVSSLSYVCPKTNKKPQKEFHQTNRLLKKGPLHYPNAIGVKTGYTSSAGYTLIAAAESEGRTLVAVLLGCDTSERRYREAKRLFEAAFAEKKITRTLIPQEKIFEAKLQGGSSPLEAALSENLEIAYFPAEEMDWKVCIHWGDLSLPVAKGASVGEVWVSSENGEIVKKEPLMAKKEVKGTFAYNFKQFFKKIF